MPLSMSRKWFRFLLLLGWVAPLTGLVSYFAEKSSMPPELRDYLAAKAARPVTGWGYFAALLVLFLFGAQVVTTRVAYVFYALGSLLNGFTLALAYFSPLARFFEPEPDARV
jgi:hypothetical protein